MFRKCRLTPDEITGLAKSKKLTREQIALSAGVTPQRISQIVLKADPDLKKPYKRRSRLPCPECGCAETRFVEVTPGRRVRTPSGRLKIVGQQFSRTERQCHQCKHRWFLVSPAQRMVIAWVEARMAATGESPNLKAIAEGTGQSFANMSARMKAIQRKGFLSAWELTDQRRRNGGNLRRKKAV